MAVVDHRPAAASSRVARPLAAALVVALLALACSSGDDGSPAAADERPSSPENEPTSTQPEGEPAGDVAWPDAEWATVSAAEAGLDAAALAEMAADAEEGGSACLVVTHEGRIVDEGYWHDTTPTTRREAFSITKSITATLVGIAQDRDLLDLDQPAADFIPEWQGTPSEAVTIRNLVANDSGRFQDVRTDYVEMAGQAADKTAFSVGLDQQHDPGTKWVYNNAAIQTLEAVLEEATGMDVGEFAEEALFAPIGMDVEMITDRAGNTLMFMGLQTSCRDLARFGLLHLRGGEWDGETVVSSEWVAEATTPSQELNEAYGYLWWLNHEGTVGAAVGADSTEGQLVPGAPEDVYAALGLGNQVAAVFPSSGIVATRLTAVSAGESTFGFSQIVTGIQAALEG